MSAGLRPIAAHACSNFWLSSPMRDGSPPAAFQTSAYRATSRRVVSPEAPIQIGGGGVFPRFWVGGAARPPQGRAAERGPPPPPRGLVIGGGAPPPAPPGTGA